MAQTKLPSKAFPAFNIIKHAGQAVTATTSDGYTVHRSNELFVKEFGRFITCAPYDEHFIYENPINKSGQASFMCTCGAPAVVAGGSAYEKDASLQGLMFVCLLHASMGHHSNQGRQRWI